MEKQLSAIVILFLTFFATAQDKTKTDLAVHNLRGNVKSVNEISYDGVEKFGEVEKGKKTDRTFWEFNSAGYEVQFVMQDFEDEDDNYSRTTRYSGNNLPVELKEENFGEVGITKIKYNGELMESVDVTDKKGNLYSRQKNKYSNGDLVQTDIYDGNGKLTRREVYTYDSKKQLIKRENFDGDVKLIYLANYGYDSRGNIIEENSRDYGRGDKSVYVRKYLYNELNQKIEERNSITGLDKRDVFEYNSRGDEVRKLDAYGYDKKKTYTYDSKNNWVKCITVEKRDGKTDYEIVERQIKYH